MPPLSLSLWVMLGGAGGAWLRMLSIQWFAVAIPGQPLGMIVVNVFGAFIVGFVYEPLGQLQFEWLKYLVIGGFLGALTTFSTFALDVYLLWQSRRISEALIVALLVPSMSLIAVFFGAWLARRYF